MSLRGGTERQEDTPAQRPVPGGGASRAEPAATHLLLPVGSRPLWDLPRLLPTKVLCLGNERKHVTLPHSRETLSRALSSGSSWPPTGTSSTTGLPGLQTSGGTTTRSSAVSVPAVHPALSTQLHVPGSPGEAAGRWGLYLDPPSAAVGLV